MLKRLIIVWAVIALIACIASAAVASWEPSQMYVYNRPDLTLTVTPSWSFDQQSGNYTYSYMVKNNTAKEYLIGFTLAFNESIPVTELALGTPSTGWTGFVRELGNKINWFVTGGQQYQVVPGGSTTFSFTSKYAPGSEMDVNTSSQNSYGFSGMTYGPAVPEPSSAVALLTGLASLAGWKLRRK